MRIHQSVVNDLVAHAQEEAPNECCGLLVATADAIVQNVRTSNADSSPSRYRVDPEQHFALIRALRGTARYIAGAYHSHPHSGATPSPTDIAEAFDAHLLYVIVSLQEVDRPDVRGFWIQNGNFVEIPLVRVP
jgi:proteasome lid subunit RPN8/RPN11